MAQLVAHNTGSVGVRGSSPLSSTRLEVSTSGKTISVRSHATAAGHPIHQQLIVFPLGLFATAVIFDIIYLAGDNQGFGRASYYMIGAGVIAGLVAAVFGLIDWIGIPSGTRAKRIGLVHGMGNVVITGLFIIAWITRSAEPGGVTTTGAFILEAIAAAMSIITGWLGGELVDRLGVGVDPDANLDAPASFDTHLRLHRG